jgi:hypothetical protein
MKALSYAEYFVPNRAEVLAVISECLFGDRRALESGQLPQRAATRAPAR